MKRIMVLFATLTLVVLGSSRTFAQESSAPMGPPNVLMIVREQIKPGKGSDHTAESHRFTQALRKAKSKWGRIGMVPIAGDENEVMYIWQFQSFADVEKMNKDIETWSTGALKADFDAIAPGPEDLHVSQRDTFAVYRPDLSYRADVNITEMRYFAVETFQVRPGQESQFANAAKIYMDTTKKANIDSHYAIYQVVSGAEAGIFLIFSPMKSLAEMDRMGADMKAFGDAMGPEGMKTFEKMSGEMFQSISSRIYAFNPKMSYVSPEFAARDKSTPSFWNPN
jgi:hypothetical protein